MRWHIAQNKRMTETNNLEGHSEFLEMSGECVSGIVVYGVQNEKLFFAIDIVFPNFRIQPNNTYGSYCIKGVQSPEFADDEIFDKAQLSGVLTFYSHTDNLLIKRTFYPSTVLPCFYEDVEITPIKEDVKLNFEQVKRLETCLGCEGYFYVERVSDKKPIKVKKGEKYHIIFTYRAYFANQSPPFETDALEKRIARIEEIIGECDLTTGDDIIDTEFAFAKVRAAESLFKTKKGLVHSPGGYTYYAAIWCNDQLEYAAPWFAFTGDKKAMEASENAFRWYESYMSDDYSPIPSSIVAEGFDYWNGAGDRGDAAMYLFGLSRFLLTTGKIPDPKQEKALEWCVEYIKQKTMDDGAVFSDSDELEGRISSGVNLSTTSLAYGGLELVSILWKKYGKENLYRKATDLRKHISKAFEEHFGAEIKGYKTYAYHKGCDEIRAWNCLPIYMGVFKRADETLTSIEDTLWCECSCKSTECEKITWDRSALYFITTLFRAGKNEKAFTLLKKYSENRLLGERVPYPIEAYPEGNKRHLSAESALYCRVITDGILNIVFNEKGFSFQENLPFLSNGLTLKNIFIDGEYRDIKVKS